MQLKKWNPLIGAGILIAYVVLTYLGQAEAAETLRGFGALVGLTDASPVGIEEITKLVAAVVGVWTLGRGVVRKLMVEIRKARAVKAPSVTGWQ